MTSGIYACPGVQVPQDGYPVFIQTGSGHQFVGINLGGAIPLSASADKNSVTVPGQVVNSIWYSGAATWSNDSIFIEIFEVDPADGDTCSYNFSGSKL